MRHLGKTKIGKVQPNKKSTYPLLRLPQECGEAIGASAHLYEMQVGGKKVFLAVLGDDPKTHIIQKMYNIIQNDSDDMVKSRLSTLESEIKELKSFLILKESASFHKNKNAAHCKLARRNSNPRSPPCEDGGFDADFHLVLSSVHFFLWLWDSMRQLQGKQALRREPFDRCVLTSLRAVRENKAIESLDNCNWFLHCGGKLWSGESPTVSVLAVQNQQKGVGNVQQLT